MEEKETGMEAEACVEECGSMVIDGRIELGGQEEGIVVFPTYASVLTVSQLALSIVELREWEGSGSLFPRFF